MYLAVMNENDHSLNGNNDRVEVEDQGDNQGHLI